jgi:hypothetical protein
VNGLQERKNKHFNTNQNGRILKAQEKNGEETHNIKDGSKKFKIKVLLRDQNILISPIFWLKF